MGFAFIVDGQTEKKIVQNICPDAPVRMTNLNGKSVSVGAIAKRISSLIKLLKGRYFPVLVVVDRESRQVGSEELEQAISAELATGYGIDMSTVIVACPDRMIENWMLADPVYFKSAHGISLHSGLDGKNGKVEIKRALLTIGVIYHELTVGVDTFIRVDPAQLRLNSPSFERLALRTQSMCKWMRLGV